MTTKLLYLEDFTLFSYQAHVTHMFTEGERTAIVLDQTVFYPQGGGQQCDQGTIQTPSSTFTVTDVRLIDGMLKHFGSLTAGTMQSGDAVECHINQQRRTLNSRLHSAGHVVDMAVDALKLGWTSGKAFHFPEGPYVEYTGSIDPAEKENIARDIESACNAFISEKRATSVHIMTIEDVRKVCRFVSPLLPTGKPLRVVMYGDFGVPCGGTHVCNLADIGHMTIRKIKIDGSNVRVGYDIER